MESSLATSCDRELKRRGAWWINVHGTSAGRRGIPDRIVIYRGHPLTIELKQPTGRVKPLQEHEMRRIRQAGGTTIVGRTINDVRQALDEIDQIVDRLTAPVAA